MAHLTPRGRSRLGTDSRGQFLLIGAFGIAVFLLVFAGVLNTVSFTESTASRTGEQPTEREITALQEDVRRGVGGSLVRINNDTDAYSVKEERLNDSVGNWSDAVSRQYEQDVVGVDVSLQETDRGSRITQSASRSLTNASGVGNWTLATAVPDTRRFQLQLERNTLVSGSCGGNACYELVVDDGASTWTVSVNRSAVTVDGPATTGRCAIQSDPVTVDVTGGTVDGEACEPLTFAEGLSGPYDIRYRNGGNANGTYRMLVNQSVANGEDYGPAPTVTPVVYAAYVQVEYQSPKLRYAKVLRVARGESDA